MGGAFGLMFTSLETQSTQASLYGGKALEDLPFRQQLRAVGRDMATRSWSLGKNFAAVGALYSTTECVIESVSLLIGMFHVSLF
jgi:hypothetical protein